MISQLAIQKILGITDTVFLKSEEMTPQLNVSFYPQSESKSEAILGFAKRLEESFVRLNINIVPPEFIWENVPLKKRVRRFVRYVLNDVVWSVRKFLRLPEINFYIDTASVLRLSGKRKIKKGICVVCLGEQKMSRLPMQYISNFKDNTIVTIVDFPKDIDEKSSFESHFDTAMSLFAYHMTNIVLAVDDHRWMIYNFNASHPVYRFDDGEFDQHVLGALVPKIAAPISPHKFKEFKISPDTFRTDDSFHRGVVEELVRGAKLFDRTGLYPKGKKIDELPFRHNFHRLIGKLHLDNRNGMSFGFFAYQMPTVVPKMVPFEDFKKQAPDAFTEDDFFVEPGSGKIFIMLEVRTKKMVLPIPPIWVMSLRSGSDKVNFNPEKDLLKLGLIDGAMWMELPQGLKVDHGYKPSFDTKLILAHAVGNVIVAAIMKELDPKHPFVQSLESKGISISHWHGYFNSKLLPPGVGMYGMENPHVSCSSPQSAVYALAGKLESFYARMNGGGFSAYRGDVHIEPHHGTNICFPSLIGLGEYLLENPDASKLGNKYLHS